MEITANNTTKEIEGLALSFVPPGTSSVKALTDVRLVCLFTIKSNDLLNKCSNASSYENPHPHVAQFNAWPDPTEGYRLRSYSLDVPQEKGRFGRIWRCSTFMVNFLYPYDGPRDATKIISP